MVNINDLYIVVNSENGWPPVLVNIKQHLLSADLDQIAPST